MHDLDGKTKQSGGKIMLRYPRRMHGGELWAIIEVLEQV